MVDSPAQQIKNLTVEIEESSKFGRLLDLDVLRKDGSKVSRGDLSLSPRRCLLCGRPAAECSRSRAHSVTALQTAAQLFLQEYFDGQIADRLAALACQALLYEACVTPKPGLVDRHNNGSHQDMNIFSFMASAAVIEPYFRQCVLSGIRTADQAPEETLVALRWQGKAAEKAMYQAAGANTHKGAIFSIGILCGAMGRLHKVVCPDIQAVVAQASAMTVRLREKQASTQSATTVGQRLYQIYGVSGICGTVNGGFREVFETGLPALEAALKAGYSVNDAGAIALYHLMGVVSDTNLIHRSSYARQQEVQADMAAAAKKDPFPSMEQLSMIDQAFIQENLSPGGCADLLAVTWLMWLFEKCGVVQEFLEH